jgi:CBS domain containing-hemolysin-like protein
MTILIIVVLITVFVSANCSLYEAVLYSTRRGTLESVKTQRKRGRLADRFISMKNNISEPIAAILILNTLANTAGASIAGMYATQILGTEYVPVFSIIFTLLILFLAEIMPKTIGAVHWKTFWPVVVYPLDFMKKLLSPFIFLTEKFTRLFSGQAKSATITEDELLALIHLGAHEGEISHEESKMVRNIINLEDKKVTEIMTPRKMIVSLDINLPVVDVIPLIQSSGFSRLPVFEGDKENVIGYALAKDVYAAGMQKGDNTTLKQIIYPIHQITTDGNCLSLLNQFLKHKKHIAIVKDEFDSLDGLISLEDLLETILGTEIVDETDRVVDLQEAARKRSTDKKSNQKGV